MTNNWAWSQRLNRVISSTRLALKIFGNPRPTKTERLSDCGLIFICCNRLQGESRASKVESTGDLRNSLLSKCQARLSTCRCQQITSNLCILSLTFRHKCADFGDTQKSTCTQCERSFMRNRTLDAIHKQTCSAPCYPFLILGYNHRPNLSRSVQHDVQLERRPLARVDARAPLNC